MAKSTSDDDEVAELYRLPLGEFTAARNALAKKLGAAGSDVRTLEKPNAAAWAVNQLYWQRRPAYDALIRAAQGMRTAHTQMLSGRKADVPAADAAHRNAIREATQSIRELAQAAGETLSASTLDAVAETLRTLPSDETPGRLTRPLQPLGFGALMGIGVQGPAARVQSPESRVQGPGAKVQRSESTSRSSAAARASAKKEAAEHAKKRKEFEKALREAEAAERAAEGTLADAQKAVAKVERDYAATRDRLQFLEKQRTDLESEAHKRARELKDAANARTQAA
ncbi:MAG TPA: hypothetical protein VMZ90_04845, partial [Vicinamibacterales bacterium]|nr:hypothetical protein [Vicinamibacterales bacterium]